MQRPFPVIPERCGARRPPLPLVPPTATTFGDDAGYSGKPFSKLLAAFQFR